MDCWGRSSARSRQAATGLSSDARVKIRMSGKRSSTASSEPGANLALCLEILCTFMFLFASIWMAFDGRQVKKMGQVLVCSIVGLVLGLLVFISTTVTAAKGYAGAGINPAVVRGGHLWDGHWIFWVGPTLASRKALASAESNQNDVNGVQRASSSEGMGSINFLV